jgi:hypothetical protein
MRIPALPGYRPLLVKQHAIEAPAEQLASQSSVIWKNTSIYDIRRYYFSCYRYLVETGYYLYLSTSDDGNSLDWRDCSKSRMG